MPYENLRFEGPLKLEYAPLPGRPIRWILLENLRITWGGVYPWRDGLFIKAGFDTDLSSIPRIFRSFIPQIGRQNLPSVAHDWLYEHQVGPNGERGRKGRAAADRFFLDAMAAAEVNLARRWVCYLAVRIGGGRAWRT